MTFSEQVDGMLQYLWIYGPAKKFKVRFDFYGENNFCTHRNSPPFDTDITAWRAESAAWQKMMESIRQWSKGRT
jgi:hypothetical protein